MRRINFQYSVFKSSDALVALHYNGKLADCALVIKRLEGQFFGRIVYESLSMSF